MPAVVSWLNTIVNGKPKVRMKTRMQGPRSCCSGSQREAEWWVLERRRMSGPQVLSHRGICVHYSRTRRGAARIYLIPKYNAVTFLARLYTAGIRAGLSRKLPKVLSDAELIRTSPRPRQRINNINTEDTRMIHHTNADHKSSSFRSVVHTSSLSSLTSPVRNQPFSTRRHDQPLMSLQNIPLTGTKRASVHLYSIQETEQR